MEIARRHLLNAALSGAASLVIGVAKARRAARNFQQKAGLAPADGYLGLKLLAKLRGG